MAGFKLMWNHEQRPYIIDNIGTEWIVELVNSKGELERTYRIELLAAADVDRAALHRPQASYSS